MDEDKHAGEPRRNPPSTWVIYSVLTFAFVLSIAMLVGLIELFERL